MPIKSVNDAKGIQIVQIQSELARLKETSGTLKDSLDQAEQLSFKQKVRQESSSFLLFPNTSNTHHNLSYMKLITSILFYFSDGT